MAHKAKGALDARYGSYVRRRGDACKKCSTSYRAGFDEGQRRVLCTPSPAVRPFALRIFVRSMRMLMVLAGWYLCGTHLHKRRNDQAQAGRPDGIAKWQQRARAPNERNDENGQWVSSKIPSSILPCRSRLYHCAR